MVNQNRFQIDSLTIFSEIIGSNVTTFVDYNIYLILSELNIKAVEK